MSLVDEINIEDVDNNISDLEKINAENDYHATIIIGVRKDGCYDLHSSLLKKDTLKELISVVATIAEGVLKDE
jgi:hypothetical protein